jgi:hypothetical protein
MNKTIKALALLASAILMGVSAPVMAQTAAATPAAPTVTVDGLVDAYYTYNFTDSANKNPGFGNVGQLWNSADGSYSIGLAETKFTAKQGNASAVVELAYQDDAELGITPATGAGFGVNVLEAYASYTTGAWTLTGGRFTTWMGNEVVEAPSNMNYSHSLLFWYTIPIWNQGINVSLAVDPTLSITGYATNGWNNSLNTDAFSAQTFGGELAWTPNSTWKFVLNAVDGPGNQSFSVVSNNDRWVGELIASYAPTSDWSFVLDAEYGGEDIGHSVPGPISGTITSADFWGAALYAKYAIASDWSAALRVEELKDETNALGIYANGYGYTPFEGREATLTITHAITPAWTTSLEGRYDYEVVNGSVPTAGNGDFSNGSADQLTATLSTAFVF